MGIFDKFDNLPADYVPCNEPHDDCQCRCGDMIVTGQSCSHSFAIPFNVETDLADYGITYKTGVETILSKGKEGLETLIMDDGTSIVTCPISSDEALMFDNTLLSTFAQLKFIMLDGSTTYGDIYMIAVMNPLEHTQSYSREGEITDGE